MKRILWLAVLMMAATACGEEATVATTVQPLGQDTTVLAAGPDMSGVSLEVHQAPG